MCESTKEKEIEESHKIYFENERTYAILIKDRYNLSKEEE